MSIRLRLTLLYSAILALTLIVFSTFLYVTQSRATYDSIKASLVRQADGTSNPRRFPGPPPQLPGEGPPPESNPFSGALPGRWTQRRSLDGTVLSRTFDLGDVTLPLSLKGLSTVQSGTGWFETAQAEEQPVLIYSQPFTAQDGSTQIVQVAFPITQPEQYLLALRTILVIGCGFVIVLAFAAGWVLSGMVLRPIHRITRTAQAIGAERDFGRRVQHTGPTDEVGIPGYFELPIDAHPVCLRSEVKASTSGCIQRQPAIEGGAGEENINVTENHEVQVASYAGFAATGPRALHRRITC